MILGIECTAHTFGIGLVENGKILCNIKDSYTTEKGGIIPQDAGNHHKKVAEKVYNEALKVSKVKEQDIEGIALSNAPGLAPCLIEGMKFAKKKALKLGIKIVPVNHCIAHLEIGQSIGSKDPVLLYASGANTQVIAFSGGRYRVFGETLDLGIGNFIDTIARIMGMGFPGGPKIAELAEAYKNKGVILELPYSIKGMDVAFSGIQTKLRQMIESEKLGREYTKEELAYSLQEVIFGMLVEASERALAHTGKKELVLGGGVACNKRFQEMCRLMCEDRGCKLFVPENSLLVDNGGMIAYLGEKMFEKGLSVDGEKVDFDAKERTDDIDVKWRLKISKLQNI